MKMLYKGEVVQCERCRLDLYSLRRDLRTGDPLMAAYFEPIHNVTAPVPHTNMNCCECSFPYARMNSNFCAEVHIKNVGWV